jgi:predicted transcriptional regulator
MDDFDSKVNQMRLDIEEINKEIEEIQKVINKN